ncbi:ribosomal L7Ae/L30e/S12e/Gadd45 family protein [Rummeliibacillus pycnus]|uniref:ribosomal L7Ae/L30e/S12e/Gadd45 family protein n=1 Tax=Rummeliibacillus pycnus TaxID=101070 RepID=UPI003D286CFD
MTNWSCYRSFRCSKCRRSNDHACGAIAQGNGIPVVFVDSKRELGRACEIHVGAAVNAITEW